MIFFNADINIGKVMNVRKEAHKQYDWKVAFICIIASISRSK
jgi:hypothetical protein